MSYSIKLRFSKICQTKCHTSAEIWINKLEKRRELLEVDSRPLLKELRSALHARLSFLVENHSCTD